MKTEPISDVIHHLNPVTPGSLSWFQLKPEFHLVDIHMVLEEQITRFCIFKM